MKNILITGGAGFIGSHVVRLFVTKYHSYQIVNLDSLQFSLRFTLNERSRNGQPAKFSQKALESQHE